MNVTEGSNGGSQYTLVVQNNSNDAGDICVYQTLPDLANQRALSLAWFTEHVNPTTQVSFMWDTQYSFVWDETGSLASGIVVDAGQTWPADLNGANQVTLTYWNGAFTFVNQRPGPDTGNLYITQDASIPVGKAAVGIGMARRPTFVVQAQPNMTLAFAPQADYWVTFSYFQPGQVLGTAEITPAVKIAFPPNIYTMKAVLNANNTWTVMPSS